MSPEVVTEIATRVVRTFNARNPGELHRHGIGWNEALSVATVGVLEAGRKNDAAGYVFMAGVNYLLREIYVRTKWKRNEYWGCLDDRPWPGGEEPDGDLVYALLKDLTPEEREIVTARFGIGRKEEYLFEIATRLGWSTRLLVKELDRILAKMAGTPTEGQS